MTGSLPSITIVGSGRMAHALAAACSQSGLKLEALIARNTVEAELMGKRFPFGKVVKTGEVPSGSSIVFLAVTDGAIGEVAGKLKPYANGLLVHTSGAVGLDPLRAAETRGWRVASFHPIQTIGTESGEDVFRDVPVSVLADDQDAELLSHLARIFGARPVRVTEDEKERLHIAAVFLSNYIVALAKAVEILLEPNQTGIKTGELFGPLMRNAVEQIIRYGPDKALTGPVSRGDAQTVSKHLKRLAKAGTTDISGLYKYLGKFALKSAKDDGRINDVTEEKLMKLLNNE